MNTGSSLFYSRIWPINKFAEIWLFYRPSADKGAVKVLCRVGRVDLISFTYVRCKLWRLQALLTFLCTWLGHLFIIVARIYNYLLALIFQSSQFNALFFRSRQFFSAYFVTLWQRSNNRVQDSRFILIQDTRNRSILLLCRFCFGVLLHI
jgi:hypothetical protein